MTLSQMRHFGAVCDYGSVTRAAAAMHISQPSVSSSIRELEAEFGVNLFHRVGRRLSLTKEGELFLDKLRPILLQIESLEETMRDIAGGQNLIRIGVPPMIGTFLFPAMFNDFHHQYPDAQVEIVEHGSLTLRNMVRHDELDVAIVSTNEAERGELNSLHILRTHLLYCVARGHHLAHCPEIDLEQLRGEPLILFKADSLQNTLVNRRFADRGIRPNVLLSSGQLYTTQKFVLQGKAGAFLFQEIADLEPGIIGIPLKEPIPIDIGLIWKKDRFVHSDAAKFIRFTRKYRFSSPAAQPE